MAQITDIQTPSQRLERTFENGGEFYYSIIYSSIKNKYYVISDINCDGYKQYFTLKEEDEEEILEEESNSKGEKTSENEEAKKTSEIDNNIENEKEIYNSYLEKFGKYSIIYTDTITQNEIINNSNNINYVKTNRIEVKSSINDEDNFFSSTIKEIEILTLEEIVNFLIKIFNKTEIDSGKDTKNFQGNIYYTITSTENQKKNEYKNVTTIDLGYCEFLLKKEYNISEGESLYIIKFDIFEEGFLIPKIEYEVFYPLIDRGITKLNMSICEKTKIDISIPVEINDDIDKYNKSSHYYNNICSKATSKKRTDITLDDRRKEFVENNMTLCEEDCELVSYNFTSKKSKCSCNVKVKLPLLNEIKINKTKLYESFTNIINISNIEVIKCYKIVFKLENIKTNYGFFFYLVIFILFFISLIIFVFKDHPNLKRKIKIIIEAKKQEFNLENKIENKQTLNEYNTDDNKLSNKIIKKKKKKKKKIKRMQIKENFIKIDYSQKLDDLSLQKSKTELNKNNISSSLNQKIIKDNNIKDNSLNLRDLIKMKDVLEPNDYELNSLSYQDALVHDKRTYSQFYLSLLRTNHLLIFSFYYNKSDYNSRIIKAFLFFFFISMNFTVNALFFVDDTIHKIYIEEGSFNFIYQLPQIIYSSLISAVISTLIKYLGLSQKEIIKIKQEKNLKKK